jgi:hypothetical protein
MLDLNKIIKIEGLEEFTPTGGQSTGLPYIKVVTSTKAQISLDQPLGTVYIGSADEGLEVLAKTGEAFKFIPLAYYTDWTVWEDMKMIKKAFAKTGLWSDGSKILASETSWVNGVPPTAQEAMNFVVVPVSELARGADARPMILSITFSNKSKVATAKALLNLIVNSSVNNNLTGMRHAAYSLTAAAALNEKDQAWYEFTNPTFLKVIADSAKEIVDSKYPEIKQTIDAQKLMLVAPKANNEVEYIPAPKAAPVQVEAPKEAEVVAPAPKAVPKPAPKAVPKPAPKAAPVVEIDEDVLF